MIKFLKPSNENAVLEAFPSFGFQAEDGTWRVQVSGWAYFPYKPTRRKRLVLHMLSRVMHASEEDLNSEIFKRRVEKFVSDGSAGHEISFRLGDFQKKLHRKNKRNGHFREWVRLSKEQVETNSVVDANGRRTLNFQIETELSQIKPIDSHANLLSGKGLSIISDIDDTIKVSNVDDRHQLLANTFLREFQGIDGMAELYNDWFQQGADFHYVSSSPWQLHAPLLDLQDRGGFPGGTIHLRNFQLRNHVVQRALLIRRHGKSTSIKSLLQALPDRKFILIGDSGEKDPEIYRKICRKYSGQIAGMFIRDMKHNPVDAERLAKCRDAIPNVVCEKFESADDLRKLALPVLGSALQV